MVLAQCAFLCYAGVHNRPCPAEWIALSAARLIFRFPALRFTIRIRGLNNAGHSVRSLLYAIVDDRIGSAAPAWPVHADVTSTRSDHILAPSSPRHRTRVTG